ncbi:hypothetical protein L2E82_15991 [Cichorium intybus]|uniref:Uncharacterized protein n=1 Tax=Cichorium intybus TaxID=13427 RepID=A0ACB9F3Y8_CICIN|nr:hypothetical protein L2E82_15991 [Cichorium intybus]
MFWCYDVECCYWFMNFYSAIFRHLGVFLMKSRKEKHKIHVMDDTFSSRMDDESWENDNSGCRNSDDSCTEEDVETETNNGSKDNDSSTEDDVEESSSDEEPEFTVVESPGGKTKLWKPLVPKEYMPDLKKAYDSIDEAVEVYKLYAEKAGFGVRKNTTSYFGDKTLKTRTNKYDMVFVPFTAIDNHKRSITVGAGLLSNETIESYKWLLEAFLKAHKKEPTLVLTDQDAAIKQAVQDVLPRSKHRWCMWHIMKKLQKKVPNDFWMNSDFKKEFNKLVWNVYLEPEEFEMEWNVMIKKYKLHKKRCMEVKEGCQVVMISHLDKENRFKTTCKVCLLITERSVQSLMINYIYLDHYER